MKNSINIILIILLLSGCSFDKNKRIESNQEIEITDEETYSKELDLLFHLEKLRFFGYEAESNLDSLRIVIENSKTVKAYNWNAKDRNPANVCHYIVDAYGVFDERVELEIILDGTQINKLESIICDSVNYSDTTWLGTSSFIPHIAFVYFDEYGSIIGQSNYCYLFGGGIKNVPKTERKRLSKAGNKRMIEFCEDIGLEFLER